MPKRKPHQRLVVLLAFTLLMFQAGCRAASPPAEPTVAIPSQMSTEALPTKLNDTHPATPTAQKTSSLEPIKSDTAVLSSTITSVVTKTPVPETDQALDLYFFTYYVKYAGIRLTEEGYTDLEQSYFGTPGEPPGPGAARYLKFSHYANKVAYWAGNSPLELFVSDITGSDPQLALSTSEDNYPVAQPPFVDERVSLVWSADDRYLFVEVNENPAANLVYDLETGETQKFMYRCDRVAISPKTDRLATWCLSKDESERYAVVEWGEEIWYSDSPPANILVERNDEGKITWEWSANGDRIAYFDQNDPAGYLHIVDGDGKNARRYLPGSAYWLADQLNISTIFSPEIQWSFDGNQILLYAKGDALHPCPGHVDIYQGKTLHIPCWMVINSNTGEVVWTLSQLSSDLTYSGTFIEDYFYTQAAISPDGRYLALNADYFGSYFVELVEISSGKILSGMDSLIDGMRWRNY